MGPRRSSSDGARGPSADRNGESRSTHSSFCSPIRGRPRSRPSSGHDVAGTTFALMSVGRIRLRIRTDQSVQMRPALSLHIRHSLCCDQCRFQSEHGLLPGADECCVRLNVGQPNSTHVLSEKVAPHFSTFSSRHPLPHLISFTSILFNADMTHKYAVRRNVHISICALQRPPDLQMRSAIHHLHVRWT